MGQINKRLVNNKWIIQLYFMVITTKFVMEYAYYSYLHVNEPYIYPVDIQIKNLVIGSFCITLLFVLIKHKEITLSTFMLQLFFMTQIIPITIIYEMQNENLLYYLSVIAASFICELLVFYMKPIKMHVTVQYIDLIIIGLFLTILLLFLVNTYQINGLPSTMAINIYNVYKLRQSGRYQIGKYWGYVQDTLTTVAIPILLTKYMVDRKYIKLFFILAAEVIIYLYAGHKMFLFSGILIIVVVIYSQCKKFVRHWWMMVCIGISILALGVKLPLIDEVFSLLVRRVMLVPANNKFKHYDFFSKYPKEGLAGIFPRWIINIPSNYESGYPNGYTYQISAIYYNQPEMNSNTGFLAEGYMRWGIFGVFLCMVVFAILLKVMDGFQKRTSYTFALGCCILPVFLLTDSPLISSVMFGPLGIWLLFMLFYRSTVRIHFGKYKINMSS